LLEMPCVRSWKAHDDTIRSLDHVSRCVCACASACVWSLCACVCVCVRACVVCAFIGGGGAGGFACLWTSS
jgi:hypothetical protein